MSPIIYTPHDCDTPTLGDFPYGTIWQCETCQALWGATSAAKSEWVKIEDPHREHRIEDAFRRARTPSTPTVTPRMVQLVIDTYTDHTTVIPGDGAEPLGWCGECETGIYGPHTIQAHAREKAVEALQEALAAGAPR